MNNDQIIPQKKDVIVLRKIHDSFFLIDISDNYKHDRCSIYEINETGMFIWNSINGERDLFDITHLLKAAIIDDVPYETIYGDVCEFINEMRARHFVEV